MLEIERVLIEKKKNKKKNFISKFWKKTKRNLINNIPLLRKIKSCIKKDNITFSGWGMTITDLKSPWNLNNNKSDNFFLEAHKNLLNLIKEKKFRVTQFETEDTDYKKIMEELKWRFYIILIYI